MVPDGSSHRGHLRLTCVTCGLHDEGLRVVEQLVGAGVGVVVVDVVVDDRRPETLDLAGVDRAAALACVEVDRPPHARWAL